MLARAIAHITQPAVSEELWVIGHSPDCAVAVVDNCVLLLWRARVTIQGALWLRQAFVGMCKEPRVGKFIFVTAVDPSCDISTAADVRKEIGVLLKEHAAELAGAAIVCEGAGFRMTIVRSVITAINMATRSRFPNAVFGNLESAMDWLRDKAASRNVVVDPGRVMEVVARLRRL